MKKTIYFICFSLFAVHQILQKGYGINIPFIHSYLDDFLLFPILMPFLDKVYSFLTRLPKMPFAVTLVNFFYITIVVEFIFPKLTPRFTFDWWDFLAYGLGFVLWFFVFWRRE